MTCRNLQIMLSVAVLIGSSGCMGTEADIAAAESDLEADVDSTREVEPTRIALRTGASVGADEIDGYCENGAGVYLSATEDTAELIVYVVTPAESVTFERPSLRLTTLRGEDEVTEVMEFDSVSLLEGESWVFSEAVDGRLVDVVAEVGAE